MFPESGEKILLFMFYCSLKEFPLTVVYTPYENVCESSVIQANSLKMDAVKFFEVVVGPSFMFSGCNSNMTAIYASNYIGKATVTIYKMYLLLITSLINY